MPMNINLAFVKTGYKEVYSLLIFILLQHANEDVEKMILGNKCDMEDKRQVSKDKGDNVRILAKLSLNN